MRASKNVSLKSRRQVTFTDFRGVDFSSSPLRVNHTRATDMQNLICDFGINRKRNGWRELHRFEGRINGIFDCARDNSYLVHAGTEIFRVDKEYGTRIKLFAAAKDQPSTAFVHYDELYILCGKFMVYRDDGEGYKLRNVDESIAYTPTTTISINAVDGEGVPKGTQESLEDTNVLTRRRKNKLVGDSAGSKYLLDGIINSHESIVITVEFKPDKNVSIVLDALNEPVETREFSSEDGALTGTVTVKYKDGSLSSITFNQTTEYVTPGESNITVEYSAEGDAAVDLSACTFGMKFGADGNTDRLFLGGHPDYPNEDFYSEQDNFLYFPPGNRTTFGTDDSPIVGYARLSDTTQVIYKAENPVEATIYYRTGTNNDIYDENRNFIKTQAVFPISAGGIGEGVISRRACANFAGDVLMLSSNGVFGVTIGENVATSERYAKERSRSINARLVKNNLKDAVAIVYKNRYYLAVDGVCYVADAKYKYIPSDSVDGTYNYEWWYWTNIPACCFAEIDGALYFGTADGRVCVFDSEYTDRDNHLAADGDFSINIGDKSCYYNPNGSLHGIIDGDTITLDESTSPLHLLFIDSCEVDDNGKVINVGDLIINTYEGMRVFCDNVGDSDLKVDTPYYITDIDRGVCSFALMSDPEDYESVVRVSEGTRLSIRINGRPWLIGNVYDNEFSFVSERMGKIVKDEVVSYNGAVPTELTAVFTHHTNVVAKWFSAVMDLGTNVYSKSLLKLTVVVDIGASGPVKFGYETRLTNTEIAGKKLGGLSFDDVDFNEFSFTPNFASSYTVRVNERNFNYIIFRFVSDTRDPCAVHNLTATYKINKENRGVM